MAKSVTISIETHLGKKTSSYFIDRISLRQVLDFLSKLFQPCEFELFQYFIMERNCLLVVQASPS